MKSLVGLPLVLLFSLHSTANLPQAPKMPIKHCYHWLNERTNGFLTYKYNHAVKTGGEFSFFTTGGNGAVAGAGIYCAKTLLGSYGYGDRVVKLELVDDVVLSDGSTKLCGTNGDFYRTKAECESQPVDIELFNHSAEWYVIKRPEAIRAWTANDDSIVQDLNQIKAYGTPGSNAHFDATLALINLETTHMRKVTFQNPNSRLDILDILSDPKKISAIPLPTLIEIIALAPNTKLSEAQKRTHLQSFLLKMYQDPALTFSYLQNIVSRSEIIRSQISRFLDGLKTTDLTKYNVGLILASIDRLKYNVTDNMASALWSSLWTSKASYEGLLALGLTHPQLLSKFASFVPTSLDVTGISEANLIPLIELLNAYLPQDGKRHTQLMTGLLQRLAVSPQYYRMFSFYQSLTNPALDKEGALGALLSQFANAPNLNLDLLMVAQLASVASVDVATLNAVHGHLTKLRLKTSSHLTYLMLEDFVAGHIKLPSTIKEETFLKLLVDRSLAERSLGANTTNTYRMILSGFFGFFSKRAAQQPDDNAKANELSRAANFFMSLSEDLAARGLFNYSYAALQNSHLFSGGFNPGLHPLSGSIASEYRTGNTARDKEIEMVLSRSLDSSVLLSLNLFANGRGELASKARHLLASIFSYYNSTSFRKLSQTQSFKVVNTEKRIWPNFWSHDDYAPRGRIRSDICSFTDSAVAISEDLKKVLAAQWTETEKNLVYYRTSCRSGAFN